MTQSRPEPTPPLVVVLGPTASGKSDVAMAAARAVAGTEIVAVDAMQVYRGMDIGTAKPTPADQAAVAHHGIDLVEPSEPFGVTEYVAAYDRSIAAMDGRPLLGGGHRAVPHRGPGSPGVPRSVPDRARRVGGRARRRRTARPAGGVDPVAAARMEPGNRRRVVRALEVTIGSGRPFSSFGPGVSAYPATDATLIGLRWARDRLTDRVEQRVRRMMGAGLLDEVRRVRAGGMSHTAAQALGYKELLAHLDGEATLDEAVATIVVRTRQFAVRQERWFRRDPRIRWVHVVDDPVAEITPLVVEALRAG